MVQQIQTKERKIMALSTKHRQIAFRDEAPQGVEQKGHQAPDPEVCSKGKRRAMTAAYKNRILKLADAFDGSSLAEDHDRRSPAARCAQKAELETASGK